MLKVTFFIFLTLFDFFGIRHSCMNFPILFGQHIYLVLCEHSCFCWRRKKIQREVWCAPQFSFSFQKISCKILLSLNKDKPPVFLLIYVLVLCPFPICLILKVTFFFPNMIWFLSIHSYIYFPIWFELDNYLMLYEPSCFCWRSKRIERKAFYEICFSFSFHSYHVKFLKVRITFLYKHTHKYKT